MRKQILLYFSIIIFSTVFGQTIQELEYDLSYYKRGEEYGDKIDKAKKLQELDPFNYSAVQYICRYYDNRDIDSVTIFFDNLIANYPNNSEPYLLRSELLYLEQDNSERDDYNRLKLKYLKAALEVGSLDTIVITKLAKFYYKDFILPLEKEKKWVLS